MKKFFFVIWGDPKFYQTLIFLSQKLSTDGMKVYILSKNLGNSKDIIKKVNFGKNVELLKSPTFLFGGLNILNYLIFNFFVILQVIKKKPSELIFFNKKALFNILFTKFFLKKANFIYHNFDFELIKNTENFKEKILVKLEFICSRMCNHLVFPSRERASIFKKFSKNKFSEYHSCMNCFPKKFNAKNSSQFKKFLIKNNFVLRNIVCHLGSIGPNHYLEEIIDSFKFLNNKIILVIGGSSIYGYADKLKIKINKNNLQKRIFLFEDISNKIWFEILKNSKLGLCFYKQSNLSHKFMAGTSQKFNNYLSANIPMIVNENQDFKKFKKKYDIFEMVDPNNTKLIAKKIDFIFKNKDRYKKIKKNLNIAFKNELNFDKQFEQSYKKII